MLISSNCFFFFLLLLFEYKLKLTWNVRDNNGYFMFVTPYFSRFERSLCQICICIVLFLFLLSPDWVSELCSGSSQVEITLLPIDIESFQFIKQSQLMVWGNTTQLCTWLWYHWNNSLLLAVDSFAGFVRDLRVWSVLVSAQLKADF